MSFMKLTIISILILGFYLLSINITLAAIEAGGLKESGNNAGFKTEETNGLAETIGRVIKAFLSFLGVTFLVYIVIGADKWMTSAGNSEQVSEARKMITNSIVGLIIVFLAYVLANFVIGVLIESVAIVTP
jgi:hypothetical protein